MPIRQGTRRVTTGGRLPRPGPEREQIRSRREWRERQRHGVIGRAPRAELPGLEAIGADEGLGALGIGDEHVDVDRLERAFAALVDPHEGPCVMCAGERALKRGHNRNQRRQSS
jgi:hypothetical protein